MPSEEKIPPRLNMLSINAFKQAISIYLLWRGRGISKKANFAYLKKKTAKLAF